jgi:holin-like protein
MVAGLVQILLFQGLGELAARFFLPLIPGPVIGLVLLVLWLRLRGGVPESVDVVATAFSQNLGLLFIPAAVGVVMFWPHIRSNALAVSVALVASVVATLAVTALVLRLLAKEPPE